jgi:NADH:ubiquinone oxidoreductase subunit 5 (subunit L)/multisubunit Na+/H+ antiporter MnhA subunit
MRTWILLVAVLAVIIGIVLLQIFLSKKENKWLGLILPLVSVVISLIAYLAVMQNTPHTAATMLTTLNGEIVRQETTVINETSTIILRAVFIFILYNIPTTILLAIYKSCRGKRKSQRTFDTMSV